MTNPVSNPVSQVPTRRRKEGGGGDLAYNTAKQKVVQLAKHEERRRKDVEPHRADLVEDREHNIRHEPKVEHHARGGPDAREHEQRDAAQRFWVRRGPEDGGDAEADVEGNVRCCGEEGDGERVEGDEGGGRPVFDDLRRDEAVG